jgi:hypothetical protein
MEYNMIAPAMFPTYGMHQNNHMMYHHHQHQQPNQPFSNFTPPGVTQTANTPQ